MNSTLVKATEHDFSILASLAKEIWNHHYVPIIGQQQVNYMLQKMYSLQALLEQVKEKGHEFYFIETNQEKAGFVSVEWKKDQDTVFIHKFYVLPQQQKSGLGTKVFQQIISLFPKEVKYKLTVNRQNYKSINFYFKNGFVIEQVADFDIGEGYWMNDFVMVRC